jgi:hypothetical protein
MDRSRTALIHSIALLSLLALPLGARSEESAPGLQCYGKAFESISTNPQFEHELFQLDGTCYSYAATAGAESAYARKHGKTTQILPTLPALRQARDPKFNLGRILQASEGDPATGTIGRIPRSFFDGGLVATVRSGLKTDRIVPKYTSDALREYKQFSEDLVGQSSCQYYDRESDHQRIGELEREYASLQNQFKSLQAQQDGLFRKLDSGCRQPDESGRPPLEQIRALNNVLESMVNGMERVSKESRDLKKLMSEGTEGDRQLSCEIPRKAGEFESELRRKYGSVDLSGIEPLVLYSELGKASCTPEKAEQRRRQLLRALCAGIPVSIGTPSMAKFLVRGGLRANKWETYAPSGASGDAPGQGHAMTLKGFQDINGVPHFIFRNSWGWGSEAALPVSETCALDEAVIFVDSDKPTKAAPGTVAPAISERDAWISGNDDALRQFSSQRFRSKQLEARLR